MARRSFSDHTPLVLGSLGVVLMTIMALLVSMVLIRFIFLKNNSEQPHYHADFAIYVEGVLFNDYDLDRHYYEEVTACSESEKESPQSRVHLHAPDPGIVHVHDYAVTWSHFLANLGIVLADDYLAIGSTSYLPDGQNQLRFILNGQQILFPASKVIGNEDVLLIDYGSDPLSVLQERYQQIEIGAPQANQENDPYGCFGSDDDQKTFGQRLWRALQIWH